MQKEIISYIEKAQKYGLEEKEIKQNLLNAGWEASVVEESINHFRAQIHQLPANKDEDITLPTKQNEIHEKVKKIETTTTPSAPNLKNEPESKNTHGNNKRVFFAIALVSLVGILLAGGAFGYYEFVYKKNLPTKIWEKYSALNTEQIYQNKFNLTYSDKLEGETGNLPEEFKLANLKLGVDGDIYIDTTDPKNLTSESEIKYTFTSDKTTFPASISYKILNQNFYLKIKDNPLFNSISTSLSKDKEVEWLMLNLSKVNELSDNKSPQLEKLYSEDFKNEVIQTWKELNIVKVKSFVGIENENKIKLYHFKNELDKNALKQFLNIIIVKISKQQSDSGIKINSQDLANSKKILNLLVDKIEIKDFDIWINSGNNKPYKIHLVTNAPSIINTAKVIFSSYASKSDLEKRISDIEKIQSALESFNKDYSGYPEGLEGTPKNLENYIGTLPTPPKVTGKNCNDYYNHYWYEPLGNKKVITKNGEKKTVYEKFEVTFCLDTGSAKYKAGFRKLTPTGIGDSIPCPGSEKTCPQNSEPTTTQDLTTENIIDSISFKAELTIDTWYNSYGEKKNVTAPENFIDVLDLIKNSISQTNTTTPPVN